MQLDLGNKFLDTGDLKDLGIWKSVGEHSRLVAIVHYAEADILDNLADLIGQPLACCFEDGDVKADLFGGLIIAVELVSSESEGRPRTVQVIALSESVKADLVPRNRVFQDGGATLGDIVDKVLESGIVRGERKRGDFSVSMPLSVQYEETDFQYLKRLLGASGVPIVVDDINRQFYAGPPESNTYSIADEKVIGDTFVGCIAPLLSSESYATAGGRLGELQYAVSKFADSLKDRSQYFTSSIHEEPKKRQQEALSAFDGATFLSQVAQQKIRTKRVFMAVGDKVQLEKNGSYTIRDVTFRFSFGEDRRGDFYQQYSLIGAQELLPTYDGFASNSSHHATSPTIQALDQYNEGLASMIFQVSGKSHTEVPWCSRVFVAEVTKNEGDPEALGRVQVRFDWEGEGPEESKQCWVDVLTPFAGHADKTYGLLMLPEVGEKVLIRFIEPGDDKPVVIGSLRRSGVIESLDTAKYKVIRTPSGNCIDLISNDGKETIRLRAGQSDQFHLVVETSEGKTQVTLECNDSLLIKGRNVSIEGQTVSIESQNSVKLEAGTDLAIKSITGTEMESADVVKIKGSLIELN